MSRESDVQKLVLAVLELPTIEHDDDSRYDCTCPLCFGEIRGLDKEMKDIEHLQGCAYLIAKDLSTGYT